ncbi:MAG: hypothetical protein ACI8TP_000774 [Acidimicrobiales bacterium]|jgi:hypothetical protein
MGWVGSAVSTSPSNQRVWYAAYGSNILAARFHTYLAGGAIPGSTNGRIQDGSRNRDLPTESRPFLVERTLLFARRSSSWGGGGVAFLHPTEQPDRPTRGRVWNITLEQLADVYQQENKAAEPPMIDLELLVEVGHLDMLPSWYGRLIYLGHLDEVPVLSFTSPSVPEPLNPPHQSYREVIVEGLAECWDISLDQARESVPELR